MMQVVCMHKQHWSMAGGQNIQLKSCAFFVHQFFVQNNFLHVHLEHTVAFFCECCQHVVASCKFSFVYSSWCQSMLFTTYVFGPGDSCNKCQRILFIMMFKSVCKKCSAAFAYGCGNCWCKFINEQ